MSFKILYITATISEADAMKRIIGMIPDHERFLFGNFEISLLVAGVGSVSTAWAMNHWLSMNEKPDLAINAGIAGSYNDAIKKGDVVMPVSDCFADAGIEDEDKFYTLAEAGLMGADEFPYSDGRLCSDSAISEKMRNILKPVRAITVNTATGSETTRRKLMKKFNPDIETMEGATFFYICSREKIPFLAIRAISNKVEQRNILNWNISLALNNLSEKLKEVILTLK
jgi:futalosine hydrolase